MESNVIKEKENEGVCIGIDLGTTNSCVGYYRSNGDVDIILNDQGGRTTPSFVSFDGSERHIGAFAKNNCGQNPTNTVYDVKRMIGKRYSDESIQSELKHLT